jgi:hypothetical protein
MDSDGATNPVTRLNKWGRLAACARPAVPLLVFVVLLQAQVPFNPSAAPPGRGRGGRGPAISPKQAAPIDMTGYWVSVVTEDWRFRMVTPPKGNYSGVPLNATGRKVADAWDPSKDIADGNECRAYGAPGLMRVPGRLHVTWQDDNTMKIETDAGTQTRLFHFGAAEVDATSSLQGYSAASWEMATTGRGEPRAGNLKVVTTHLLPGYLRKNGVPYGANTILTEWYDRVSAPNGDEWLVVSTEVKDPQYLSSPFITSTHFKKQADARGWMPEACSAK